MDYAGALIYATWHYMQRDATVTEFIWNNIDLVEGYLLHLTNTDKSRTYVSIFMHADRLYIAEATVPAGAAGTGTLPAGARMDRRGRQEHPLSDDVSPRSADTTPRGAADRSLALVAASRIPLRWPDRAAMAFTTA